MRRQYIYRKGKRMLKNIDNENYILFLQEKEFHQIT